MLSRPSLVQYLASQPIRYKGGTVSPENRPVGGVMLGIRRLTLLLASCALLSCGDDLATPSRDAVVGTYRATRFTATQSGITANLLNVGAALSLTLADDGAATGHLFAPGLGLGGADVNEDLSGTWTLSGQSVHLSFPAATLIRDMTLRVEDNQLVGEESFEDTRLQLVLTRN
jgi:hypothetical protein